MIKRGIILFLLIVFLCSCGSAGGDNNSMPHENTIVRTVELTTGFIPSAINAFEEVAGWQTNHEGIQTSAVYSDFVTKEMLTGQFSLANALNKQGIIVGIRESYGSVTAFIYDGYSVLNIAGIYYSEALDINNANEVVGYYYTGSETLAFYYNNGTLKSLGTLGGVFSSASSVNNLGHIAGHSEINSSYHAFIYKGGFMKDLGTLGGENSSALDLNDSGQVVGFSEIEDVYHAFLYENDVMKDLGTFGGLFSSAKAINNSGTIVGWSFDKAGNSHGFVYEEGNMSDLNILYPRKDCVITEAIDINDAGYIAAVCELGDLKKALVLRHETSSCP